MRNVTSQIPLPHANQTKLHKMLDRFQCVPQASFTQFLILQELCVW